MQAKTVASRLIVEAIEGSEEEHNMVQMVRRLAVK